jgi:pilus assembly protein Flp/PilA
MSKNTALKATVATQLRVSGWKNTAIERLNRRTDKGQTSVEYIGMLVAVIAIIAIVVTMRTNIGTAIGNKIQEVIGTSGKSGG